VATVDSQQLATLGALTVSRAAVGRLVGSWGGKRAEAEII